MAERLFDVQTGFGGMPKGKPNEVGLDEMLGEMKRLRISGALVRYVPDELEEDWALANEVLFRAARKHRGLVPCPLVVPSSGGDWPAEEEQVERAIRRGAKAVWLRAGKDHWSVAEWSGGRLLRALEARRMPAFCLVRDVTLEQVAEVAGRHPRLPIIVAGVDYRMLRMLVALMQTYGGVHLSIGNNFTTHGGVETLVKRVGAERLLFGTGFPDAEAMMAATLLGYADISEADRRLIGSGNFRRLAEEIKQ